MLPAVRTVIFDVDDTLYDHSHHIHSGISALRNEHQFLQAYSIEYLKQLSHELLEEAHLKLLAGELSISNARRFRWRKFLEKFNQEDIYDVDGFSTSYVKAYYDSERVVPGAIELLQALKKEFSLGIISNNLLDEQLGKLRRLGINEYFDFFAISEEVGAAKPDRKIFETALERAKVKAEEAVYIGDVWDIDIIGALNAHIRPIWLNRKGLVSPDTSVAEISSFEPVANVLRHIRNERATPQITRPDPASA